MILGTGSYVPEKILTNFDLEKMVDTTDEWIRERSGIERRHILEDGKNNSDIATEEEVTEGAIINNIILAPETKENASMSTGDAGSFNGVHNTRYEREEEGNKIGVTKSYDSWGMQYGKTKLDKQHNIEDN